MEILADLKKGFFHLLVDWNVAISWIVRLDIPQIVQVVKAQQLLLWWMLKINRQFADIRVARHIFWVGFYAFAIVLQCL